MRPTVHTFRRPDGFWQSPSVSALGLPALTGATALSCAAVGGVFFTFSTFTIQGLARLPAAQGAAAMQSINVTAVRPAFMIALFGTGSACAVMAARGVGAWGDERSPLLIAGASLYLVGVVGVTIAANVPLNDTLARVDVGSGAVEGVWRDYLPAWTRWNHVRTVSALAAAATFAVAAYRIATRSGGRQPGRSE